MTDYDIIIIGAGAAGLMAAATAVQREKQVLILEMGNAPARKVMVSGGGKCNITNMAANADRYFGNNPQFVHSALAQVTPNNILHWANEHKLKPFEKTTGRYFCESGAAAVVNALINDIKPALTLFNTTVTGVIKSDNVFLVETNKGTYKSNSVIVATGGTSFASLGVSDVGYKIAKHFGHKIVPIRPGLCAIATHTIPNTLSGISVPVQISINKHKINDDLLFTHFGIGGPAAYRTSLYDLNDGIYIDFLPNADISNIIQAAKQKYGKKSASTILVQYLPVKLVKWIVNNIDKNVADLNKQDIQNISCKTHKFYISATDIKRHNLQSAEIVRGGVATDDISSKTMESKLCDGLFFVGEVIDIAGDLGGFNLQWAWASGIVAGNNA